MFTLTTREFDFESNKELKKIPVFDWTRVTSSFKNTVYITLLPVDIGANRAMSIDLPIEERDKEQELFVL